MRMPSVRLEEHQIMFVHAQDVGVGPESRHDAREPQTSVGRERPHHRAVVGDDALWVLDVVYPYSGNVVESVGELVPSARSATVVVVEQEEAEETAPAGPQHAARLLEIVGARGRQQ